MNNISTYAADCCAVLLRGGKSRRMGQDKALLPWGDSTFLKTVAGQMDFLDEKYLSVAANDINSADAAPARDQRQTIRGQRPTIREQRPTIQNQRLTIRNQRPTESTGPTGSIGQNAEYAFSSETDGLSEDWIRLPDLFPDRGPLGGIYTALVSCRAQWALVASCDIPAVERILFTMLLENRTEEVDIIYPLTPDGRMHMTCALYRKAIAPVILAQIEKGDNRLRILSDLCRSKEILIDQPDYLRMLSNINTGAELNTIRKSRN